jgi:putative membrane protein
MNAKLRAPQAFIIEEEKKPGDHAKLKARTRKTVIDFATESQDLPPIAVPPTSQSSGSRPFRWLLLLLLAVWTLVMMWAGLAVTQLVESFFARSALLGWLALALAALAGLVALALIMREVSGLVRLKSIETLQDKLARATNLEDNAEAKSAFGEMMRLYAGRPELQPALKTLRDHQDDIMDPSDRINLAERLLLEPLDREARKCISSRARRVTLLTTVTPAAALDILFVGAQNIAMLREIATVYGGRPSTLSTLRLARMVVTHLALTGGLALSDSLLQQLLGKGLLGRLSARLGEGAVNGILTSRIGLAAINVCRPLPTKTTTTQSLSVLLKEVLSLPSATGKLEDDADQKSKS